jgi:hypothetical protein
MRELSHFHSWVFLHSGRITTKNKTSRKDAESQSIAKKIFAYSLRLRGFA